MYVSSSLNKGYRYSAQGRVWYNNGQGYYYSQHFETRVLAHFDSITSQISSSSVSSTSYFGNPNAQTQSLSTESDTSSRTEGSTSIGSIQDSRSKIHEQDSVTLISDVVGDSNMMATVTASSTSIPLVISTPAMSTGQPTPILLLTTSSTHSSQNLVSQATKSESTTDSDFAVDNIMLFSTSTLHTTNSIAAQNNQSQTKDKQTGAIAGIIVASLAILVICLVLLMGYRRRASRKSKANIDGKEVESQSSSKGLSLFPGPLKRIEMRVKSFVGVKSGYQKDIMDSNVNINDRQTHRDLFPSSWIGPSIEESVALESKAPAYAPSFDSSSQKIVPSSDMIDSHKGTEPSITSYKTRQSHITL